jgi:predicted nucleotidyltransferase
VHVFGSYCRLEDPCSDIDFLISHPEVGMERNVTERLILELEKATIISLVLNKDKMQPNFQNGQNDMVRYVCLFVFLVICFCFVSFCFIVFC